MITRFNASFKDKGIYERSKGCFFIQCVRYEDDGGIRYNVYVDSMWKESWCPVRGMSVLTTDGWVNIGKTKDVGNPKEYLGLSEDEFNSIFEPIKI